MQRNTQHKSTFAILGVLLLLAFSMCVSFLVTSVAAATNVSIENSGSRLNAKSDSTPVSYQWQISDAIDGTYSPIADATQKYYDVTANDEGKYIKVVVDGSESEAVGPIGKLIVFDLSLGSVQFGTTYSGNDGALTGEHVDSNIYIVTQSNTETYSKNTIAFSGVNSELYDVTIDGIHLGNEPVTGKTPDASGIGSYTYGVIDLQPSGGVGSKNVILRLKGENIVRAIHYHTRDSASDSSLKITDINGDGASDGGSLYVPVKVDSDKIDEFVNSNLSYNHWNSGIGGDDGSGDRVTNLEIAGGKLQVLTTYADNCTAIGAGGNGPCTMTISGGDINAHCSGTGTAIGGGIGWHSAGGTSTVNITGGNIYAKNHGKIFVKATYNSDGSINSTKIVTENDDYNEIIGGVAIGSGSSVKSSGSEGTVNISGGTVKAYGTYGNGIGGGNSSSSAGGKATISITGGTVEASSIGGGDSKNRVGGQADVKIGGTANVTLIKGIGGGRSESAAGGEATITVTGGVMHCDGVIGGGNGGGDGNGGAADITVSAGTLISASIGGGTGGIGGNGGAAEINISGGIIKTGSIGGGQTLNVTDGKLGYAKAQITGGDITGQFLMAAGGTEPCSFTMTGGILHGVNTADTTNFIYAQSNGGAVYMDDPRGIVSISGGTIKDCSAVNGGAINMSDGTCTISGDAVIDNCVASENGGAIYMGGGTLTVNGGSIKNNSTERNGGAVYLGGGSMTVYSGEISGNAAKDSGGAAFIDGGNVKVAGGSVVNNTAANNGGGIVVNNGNYKMTGGFVDRNTAVNGAGGGIYVSTDGNDVTVDVHSGSVSNNTAKGNGGAFAVVGNTDSTENIVVTVGVNKNHFDTNGNLITDCEHGDEGDHAYTCPVLNGNKSGASGGGIYVTGNTLTQLNIYCLEEKDSRADGDNGQSNFMKVDGGKVTITTSEQLDEDNQTSYHGNTHIKSEVYVTGGQMDIWGEMTNPRLEDIITVDVTKQDDYFADHRKIPTTDKYYKLLYFENFTDPVTNVTTGQYKEVEVMHGDSVTISGNIYSHPGYTIVGWNTSNGRPDLDDYPQGTYENDRGWYKVGDEKVFDGTIIGDLTIYAIWEANGYTVVYDPNVPSGERYFGTMENYNFTYDLPTKLSKNQYVRPGYEFIGWSKTKEPDSSSVIYKDEEVVTNLTTKKGEVVTLYAQWEACDHDPATHEYTYSLVDDGKTLRRDCSCGKYSEEARLSAENTVYSMETHEAKIVYTSSKWNPVVVYEALDGDALVDGKPYHAGSYRASITENGYTASVTYTIEKAEQAAPPKPEFDTNKDDDGSVMSIKPVAPASISDIAYTSYPEYRIVYYVDGSEKTTDWVKEADVLIDGQYAAQFVLDKALTNYYIQARYSECDDYKVSPVSTADSIYFFVGDVEFRVICGEGVKYENLTSSGDDVTENGIKIAVSVEEGYFFPIGYTAVIKTGPDGLKLSLEDENPKVYSITEIPNKSTIVLELPSAKKNLKIDSAIAEKQVFVGITGNEAKISRDSAYTVFFAVENYCNEEYEELKLCFDATLPVGTTIILQDRGNSEYYWTRISAENVCEVLLTSFVRMGDNSDEASFKLTAGNMELQFIIDHSQTSEGIDGDAVTTTLTAQPKAASEAIAGQSGETADLKDVSSYELKPGTAIGEIVLSRTNSVGAASIWDGRDDALVFKPKSALPADAHLSIILGEAKIVVYANCDGNFVYSVPDQADKTISVTLISNLLGEGSETYSFEVDWIVAKSKAEYAPMNAGVVATTEVSVQGVGRSPVSLKIVGDKKLYSLNDTVYATVSWDDLPSNHKLEVVLMVKTENGDYSSTAVTQEIAFTTESGTQDISISLAGNKAGSYRLYISAEQGLIAVAEAEYYFIVN